MSPSIHSYAIIAVPLAFAASLFVFAAIVERHRRRFENSTWRRHAYALALGVYCTSWTYFGAVGTAATAGWDYLPIYIGPLILLVFAPGLLRRLVSVVQSEGATSISDFIGSRFGKSRGLAALVTVTAILGIIPYIALQLRSVGAAFATVGGARGIVAPMAIAAILFACFALLFGTRRYDAAARNEGLLYATALESLVKLLAFGSIGIFALWLLADAGPGLRSAAWGQFVHAFAPQGIGIGLVVVTGISMAAILCLPRQFYISVIEARGGSDLVNARWIFALYLLLMVLIVLPVTVAGLAILPAHVSPDLYVLALPLSHGSTSLTLLAFMGGVAAATGMVVVETIALGTMVSNDLVAPLLLRGTATSGRDFSNRLLTVRRGAMIAVIAVALLWAANVRADERLASIGQIAFAAMALIAPFLLIALRKPNNDALAAKLALTGGLLVWLYTLALPPVLPQRWLAGLSNTLIDPHHLFEIGHADALSHGVLWSLGITLLVYALVTARRVQPGIAVLPISAAQPGNIRDIRGLTEFTGRFVGHDTAVRAFADVDALAPLTPQDARRAERLIAGVVGAPSAHALIASAISGARFSYEDAARMLNASGQSLQFSKDLLAATLEHIDPGVSVVDGDLRLIAWNSRYLELFAYPPDMVRVGTPVADLIRFNAERGDCGPGEVDVHVERRVEHLRRGAAHSFERRRYDGRVLKIVGGPMPGGGYVTCFTDVTSEARAREALLRSRAELEDRVTARTAELTDANAKLADADREKTRFLAAASHDLLQPLHAARLFGTALRRGLDARSGDIADRLDQSIGAAEELLRTLLDISKLDSGGIQPEARPVSLPPLLTEIAGRFQPLAQEKGLALRIGPVSGNVHSDPALLRSVVQNFLSNAVRYTARGSILIGTRRRRRDGAWQVGISVVDTGRGIAEADQRRIFREFARIGGEEEVAGIGLGLAIVDRITRLIGGAVTLHSRTGRGSAFTIWLPLVADGEQVAISLREQPPGSSEEAMPHTVLVVDDDAAIVAATRTLLEQRGHRVFGCGGAGQALPLAKRCDVALVDFRLGEAEDGLSLIERLRAVNPSLRAALVTSESSSALHRRAEALAVPVLLKPVAGKVLEAFVAGHAVD
ncbi:PAS domain-containing hybrid sensor histidine kinase/response regulator [Stakelama sediminis]|uniref:histidine kinase n=1 Tax=Stakelama sediminis TaxID=463200 RepID=A0A840Z146_9SPHN|nr:PAS-domain containing protein [Stakelama sediminis]MBB5719499.1 Na+/proline symporter/signal transduction histidine kinase [Stakelama sediminis]